MRRLAFGARHSPHDRRLVISLARRGLVHVTRGGKGDATSMMPRFSR
jgi:hypothetical protein